MAIAARRRPPAVGAAAFEPGRLTCGELVLTQDVSGPVAAPVLVLCGEAPGPTLWVQAAIHGGEIGGSLALSRLLGRLNASEMAGSIVAVLAANPLAFRAQTRNSPQDGENMNCLFPGAPEGSITRQMAHALMRIDLHSGGIEAVVPFYALYWSDNSEASDQSAYYARRAGADTIWKARDPWLSGAMFSNMTRRGVPSVIVESGGGGAVSEQEIESFATAVEGIARVMTILPGGPPPLQPRYRLIGPVISCSRRRRVSLNRPARPEMPSRKAPFWD